MMFLPAGLGLEGVSTAGSSYINSIQPFSITVNGVTSNTTTINSVNTALSCIFYDGFITTQTTNNPSRILTRLSLASATSVQATKGNSIGSVTVRGKVVEFKSALVESVQTGTITIASAATSGTSTITSVDETRSAVVLCGWTTDNSSTDLSNYEPTVVLTNATTVTANRIGTTGVLTIRYFVIQFAADKIQSLQPYSVTDATASTTIDKTISSVTTGNCLLLWNGISFAAGLTGYLASGQHYLSLTSSTNVRYTRVGTSTTSRTFKGTVVEFVSNVVKSRQSGTVALGNGVTSNNAAISSVNTNFSFVNFQFSSYSSSLSTPPDSIYANILLADNVTVTANRNTSDANTLTAAYDVMEFN